MTSSQVNVTETPPMSRQDLETLAKNETDENGLILGKFKSVEDLAASYKELEGKLGAATEEAQAETSEQAETETTESLIPCICAVATSSPVAPEAPLNPSR